MPDNHSLALNGCCQSMAGIRQYRFDRRVLAVAGTQPAILRNRFAPQAARDPEPFCHSGQRYPDKRIVLACQPINCAPAHARRFATCRVQAADIAAQPAPCGVDSTRRPLHLGFGFAQRFFPTRLGTHFIDPEGLAFDAVPDNSIDPKQYALGLLQHRYLEDALPILEALYGMIDDAEIAYNYGICLSELGRIDESVKPLERCVHLDHE